VGCISLLCRVSVLLLDVDVERGRRETEEGEEEELEGNRTEGSVLKEELERKRLIWLPTIQTISFFCTVLVIRFVTNNKN
jgi:hypothetical protein